MLPITLTPFLPDLINGAAFHSLLHDCPLHKLPGCTFRFLVSFALPMDTR